MPGSSRRRLLPIMLGAACGLLVGCTSDGDGGAVDTAGPRGREDSDRLADELAPSQITGSTVARPDTPPTCAPADITMWAAAVDIVVGSASAVVRVRNDGAAWCEVDVRDSPRIDRNTEPDLWLEPGEWGDLWIGPDGSECSPAKAVTQAEVAVGVESRLVPISAVVPCDWTITALYGVDAAVDPCAADALASVRVADELIVRNTSFTPCRLGELASVDGVAAGPATPAAPPLIDALAAGDTVAFSVSSNGEGCPVVDATLGFELGDGRSVEIVASGLTDCDTVTLGGARPFYDGADGPLAGAPDELDDLLRAAVLIRLDPFADG